MKSPQCPNCKSTNLAVEKQPDGGAHCLSCGWQGKYSLCFFSSLKTTEQIIEEIKRLKTLSEYYCDKENRSDKLFSATGQYWFHRHSITLYKDLLSWITQENNLDGVADD